MQKYDDKERQNGPIEVKELTKDYGHGRGVFDVSFCVGEGETLGFLGPNGAGKSTTMRHLMGFSKPQKGLALINGLDTWKKHSRLIRDVGYLPGEVNLPDGLDGYGFINMMRGLKGIDGSDEAAFKRLKELLDIFELDPSGNVKRMSIGEKRKLAVVTAFMDDPKILLLDEPTSGLDPVMQERFTEFIRDEKKRGKTILLSSHIFSEVEALCDRIAIIKDGRLVSTLDSADVKHGLKNIFTVYFADEGSMKEFTESSAKVRGFTGDRGNLDLGNTIQSVDMGNCSCSVSVDDGNINTFIRLLSSFRIKGFKEHSVSLEEFFMHFYKNDKSFALG